MPHSRRSFLQQASSFSLAWSARHALAQQMKMPMPTATASATQAAQQKIPATLQSRELPQFFDPLPIPAIARPDGHGKLRIAMRETYAKVHRDVAPTRLWTYASPNAHPGALSPVIEARSGQPLHVEWINQLPTKHFLPVDFSLHGCGQEVPEVRACVHVHGGRTPSDSDGYPEDWYVSGKSRVCTYPLQQDATALWYHDHAMGLNRLNIYAGLFGQMILRDKTEENLHLPSGRFEIPLTLYDRVFTADGQLYYPASGDPEHPWVSEFDGDAILINDKIFPFLEVEPRLYRFRLLNAANSRFFQLSLTAAKPFHQIGSDQGLLPAPLELKRLQLAPAERADLLIDFSQLAGQQLHLLNGVVEVMQFRVAKTAGGSSRESSFPTALRPVTRTSEASATITRTITLDEALDHVGNSMMMYLNKKRWHEPTTEKVQLNSTEIWEFVNLTEDTHPMHLHLVRFQLLDRRSFDVFGYRNNRGKRYLSAPLPPEPGEMGWKDVIQCPPGLITRIIVRFEGYTGKYLYHCHILEHEANDMMRPFEVVA